MASTKPYTKKGKSAAKAAKDAFKKTKKSLKSQGSRPSSHDISAMRGGMRKVMERMRGGSLKERLEAGDDARSGLIIAIQRGRPSDKDFKTAAKAKAVAKAQGRKPSDLKKKRKKK